MLTLALSALLTLAYSSTGAAETDEGPDLLPKKSWEASYEIFNFDYEETADGEKLMEEEGTMHGLRLAYTGHSGRGPMFRVDGSFNYGELEYDGQTWGGDPVGADTEDYLVRLQGALGWDFQHGNSVSTVYTGLAFRYWNNEIDDTGGYEREITQFYWPIGYELAVPLGEKWVLGGGLEFELLLDGQVKSHLSDADSSFEDAHNDQEAGDGYGVNSIIYLKRDSERLPWSVGLFVNYYDIEDSDTDLVTLGEWMFLVYEPENETTEIGLRVSLYW
jgi:hypothetical protein